MRPPRGRSRVSQTRVFDALHRIALAAAASPPLDALARVVVEVIAGLLDADVAALFWWDDEAAVLRRLAATDSHLSEPATNGHAPLGVIGRAFSTGEPVVVNDSQSWPEDEPVLRAAGLCSLVAAPMHVGERPCGILVLGSYHPRTFRPTEVRLLMLLAAQVGPAVEAARRHADAERRRTEAQALAELVRRGAIEPDAGTIMARVCELTGTLVGADYATVSVIGSDGAVERRGSWGTQSDVWHTINVTAPSGLLARAIAANRTIVVDHLGDNPAFPADEFFMHHAEGGRTVVGAPLRSTAGVFGILSAGWRSDVTPTAAQTTLLETLASFAATVLENADARARAQELARQASARAAELAAVIEQMPSGVIITDARGVPQVVNDAGRRIIGITLDPTRPMDQLERGGFLHDAASGRPLGAAESPLARALHGETISSAEFTLYRPGEAEARWLEAAAAPVRDADGVVTAAVAVFTDVTRERKLLQELAASEERLRVVYDTIACGVIVRAATGEVLHANPAAQRILGRSEQQLLAMRLEDWEAVDVDGAAVPPERLPATVALATGLPVRNVTLGIARPDGGRCWVLTDAVPQVGADGAVIRVITSFTDITEQVEAQQELRRTETRYRSLVEQLPGAVYMCAPESLEAYYVSPQIQTITGYTVEEWLRTPQIWMQCIHPDDRECVLAAATAALHDACVIEYRLIARDGRTVWVHDQASLVRDDAGQPLYFQGLMLDITERQEAAEALRRSEARLRSITETAQDAIITADRHGVITSFNGGAERLFGWTAAEAVGQPLTLLMPERFREAHRAGIARVLATGETRIVGTTLELVGLRKDGSEFPLEVSLSSWTMDQELSFTGIIRDITERQRTQHALEEANKRLTQHLAEVEQRARENSLLNDMGELLQVCGTLDEAYAVIAQSARQLFPGKAGALLMVNSSGNLVEAAATWGGLSAAGLVFAPDECWALRRGRQHLVQDTASGLRCKHVGAPLPAATLCVPILAQGGALGVLHLSQAETDAVPLAGALEQLASAVADHVASSLTNLRLRETLRSQSIRDPLTNLFNRRFMEESLEREVRRAERTQRPVGVIMMDLDHFKQVNDTFGHDAGDAVLKAVGATLQTAIRGYDIACRYGGEEFTLILPETDLDTVRQRAEDLRTALRGLEVRHRGQTLGRVTASLGVAVFPQHGLTGEAVLRTADAALLRAKASGRDRVVVAGEA